MTSKRTALYYPNIVIQNRQWIRQALLYWDDIGSIVPREIWETHPYFECEGEEINKLYDERLYRPFFMEDLQSRYGGRIEDRFYIEFNSRMKFFRQTYDMDILKGATKLYELKEIRGGFFTELEEMGLASRRICGAKRVTESGHPIIFVENHTANLYMSLLAQYLADNDSKLTIPQTDQQACLDMAYSNIESGVTKECLELSFQNILPVPREDVSIEEVIDFKREYHTDLLKLRKLVDGFGDEATSITNQKDFTHFSTRKAEEIEMEVKYLQETLADRRIETIAGSLAAIVDVRSPEWWSAAVSAGVIGGGTGETTLCIIGGLVTGAAVTFGNFVLKRDIERKEILRNSPYSYVYQMQKSHLINFKKY